MSAVHAVADLVLTNGRIYTVDPARSSAEAGTLTDAFRRLADALLLLAGPRLPAELREFVARRPQKKRAHGVAMP